MLFRSLTEIALFENESNWFPYHIDQAISFGMAREKIQKDLHIKENECFKDRYLSSWLDVNSKENTELNAVGSYIRLTNKKFLQKKCKR